MRLFAADLRATGELRERPDDDEVADIVWSLNAGRVPGAAVGGVGSADRFATYLTDAWTRLLLERRQRAGVGEPA